MENFYWRNFTQSGKIEDYLIYKSCANGKEEPCEDYDGRACNLGEQDGGSGQGNYAAH
jgi:hypothetical protein